LEVETVTRVRREILKALSGAVSMLAATMAGAQTSDLVTREALRVCADPANLPFTNEAGAGFENKIAELLAGDLGIPLQYTWFPQATGFVRNTLSAKRCDVVMGYAAGSDPVQNTNPYYRSAWVLVTRQGQDLEHISSLDDPRLKGKRLGVVAGTPPATLLALNGLISLAKPYALMVDRRYESPSEDMVRDIGSGEIDGGILWGPIGGYFAKHADTPLSVVPLTRHEAGVPMTFRITFGIRHGETEWKHRLNEFIAKRQGEINRVLLDYGVPLIDEQDRPVATAR
jgi:quinoprotein dehydrogenase-associated probable ABC transporter substrate-binding protein